MNMKQNLLFLFLGWVLGLLGPIIVDEIRRRHQSSQIKTAIIMELTEIRLKLVYTAHKIAIRYGTWDRSLLEWVKSIVDTYAGPLAEPQITEIISKLLASSDEELAIRAQLSKATPLGALALKKYHTPILDTHMGMLVNLAVNYQNLIIEIKTQLSIMNEQVDLAQFYYQKTFDSGLSSENYQIIQQNLINTYDDVFKKAKHVVELISQCLKSSC